jgi:hypothetical protein
MTKKNPSPGRDECPRRRDGLRVTDDVIGRRFDGMKLLLVAFGDSTAQVYFDAPLRLQNQDITKASRGQESRSSFLRATSGSPGHE